MNDRDQIILNQAQSLLQSWKYEDAISLIENLEHKAVNDELRFILASAYRGLGDFERECSTLIKVANQTTSEFNLRLANCYSNLNLVDNANERFEILIKDYPGCINAKYYILNKIPQLGINQIEDLTNKFISQYDTDPRFKNSLHDIVQKTLAYLPEDILSENSFVKYLTYDNNLVEGLEFEDVRNFEPLGSNCEFGFVQRHFKYEPNTLFRWTSIAPENLIKLLQNNFKGFDSINTYEFTEASQGEIYLHDKEYDTTSHTGSKISESNKSKMMANLVGKQKFLMRIFFDSLEENKKIFIYKFNGRINIGDIKKIEKEMQRLGSNKLLFVGLNEDKVGILDIVSDASVVSYLSGVMPNTKFNEWAQILRMASLHFNK